MLAWVGKEEDCLHRGIARGGWAGMRPAAAAGLHRCQLRPQLCVLGLQAVQSIKICQIRGQTLPHNI